MVVVKGGSGHEGHGVAKGGSGHDGHGVVKGCSGHDGHVVVVKSGSGHEGRKSFMTLQVKVLSPEPFIIHDVTSQGVTSRTTHHSQRYKSRGQVQNLSSQNNPVFVFGVLLFASACRNPNSDEPF